MPLIFLQRILSRSTPWIAALESVDIAGDVRGGDSFSDIYGMKGFLHGFFLAWTVLLVKGTMVQFPQTYGPYKHPLARHLARFLLWRSSVVIARDEESRQFAQELADPEREVWLSPDVAFTLETVRPECLELDPPLAHPQPSTLNPQPIMGLNVSGLLFNGGYTRNNMFGLKLDYPGFLPSLIAALLREHAGELWLIPHTYGVPGSVENDLEASYQVRGALSPELQKRVRVLTGDYTCHEVKYVIGQCDFFIGARMHACIAALSQGVPCVGVAYSKKFAGVFKTVGMQEWVIDGRTVNSESAVARALELYVQRNEIRDPLKTKAQATREELNKVFTNLFASLRLEANDAPVRRRTEAPVH